MNQRDVATQLGLNIRTIQRIECKALAKLRRSCLLEYCEVDHEKVLSIPEVTEGFWSVSTASGPSISEADLDAVIERYGL